MRDYEAPSFEVIGSVRDLTLSNGSGDKLDRDFPAGTPYGDITVGTDFPAFSS